MNVEEMARRCPRLGGDVDFGYCKSCETGKKTCFKILDCWWERFDVVTHMKGCLTPEAFDALSKRLPPPGKLTSLVDLIRQAQERAAKS